MSDVTLCTYHLKTLMFWACEERSEFWDERQMKSPIRALLDRLMLWMIERRCPNYFISSNNMMDHIFEHRNFANELNVIRKLYDNVDDTLNDLRWRWFNVFSVHILEMDYNYTCDCNASIWSVGYRWSEMWRNKRYGLGSYVRIIRLYHGIDIQLRA